MSTTAIANTARTFTPPGELKSTYADIRIGRRAGLFGVARRCRGARLPSPLRKARTRQPDHHHQPAVRGMDPGVPRCPARQSRRRPPHPPSAHHRHRQRELALPTRPRTPRPTTSISPHRADQATSAPTTTGSPGMIVGEVCGGRPARDPRSSATPAPQGRRCAARSARPCQAALDRRAPLHWLAMNVALTRNLPRAGPSRRAVGGQVGWPRSIPAWAGSHLEPAARALGPSRRAGPWLPGRGPVTCDLGLRRTSQHACEFHRPVSPFKSPAQALKRGPKSPTIIPGASVNRGGGGVPSVLSKEEGLGVRAARVVCPRDAFTAVNAWPVAAFRRVGVRRGGETEHEQHSGKKCECRHAQERSIAKAWKWSAADGEQPSPYDMATDPDGKAAVGQVPAAPPHQACARAEPGSVVVQGPYGGNG